MTHDEMIHALRQFLQNNFGWDIYEWAEDDIQF